ncbi:MULTISPECIES: hypothetical protein [Thermomonosporaceae]|uniref:hypothetical protein n=1 Tax=Thermomonosporaceae TaxID=2012 RepID=UPI002E2EFC6E|nr:hypothetical protein [Spirillospora sp. NBC_01491]
MPTDAKANALEIGPERTVIEITHVGVTAEGRAVKVTIAVAPVHYLTAGYELRSPDTRRSQTDDHASR